MQENFKNGEALMFSLLGLTPREYITEKSAAETLDSVFPSALDIFAVGLVKEAYEQSDAKTSFGYHLYDTLAQVEGPWPDTFRPFVDTIYTGIAKLASEEQSECMAKQAHGLGAFVAAEAAKPVVDTIAESAPFMARALYGGAIGVGAGAGSLLWLLNRHANEDDQDLEHLKAKRKFYNGLTSQVQNELVRKGIDPTSAQGLNEIKNMAS